MELETLVQRTVEQQGYEFVSLEVSGGRRRLLRVFMDKQPGGITVDDCANLSHHLTRVFAVEGVDYERLEVSSPGLDRPLVRLADFERFAGARASVQLRLPLNGRKKFSGVLRGVSGQDVQLEVDGQLMTLSYADVSKARLVPDV